MVYDERSIAGGFLAGDPEAYVEVRGWIRAVLAAPRFRPLREEWSDLEQDVLRRVVESLRRGRFDPTLNLRTYVQSIAHYTAREALRRRIRSSCESAEPCEPGVVAVTEEQAIDAQQIREVMDRIPKRCGELLTLFYFEHLNYAEIAQRLDVPVGTVKSRLSRCLQKAAALLSR